MEEGEVTMLLCQSQGSQSISTLSCDCLDGMQGWFLVETYSKNAHFCPLLIIMLINYS